MSAPRPWNLPARITHEFLENAGNPRRMHPVMSVAWIALGSYFFGIGMLLGILANIIVWVGWDASTYGITFLYFSVPFGLAMLLLIKDNWRLMPPMIWFLPLIAMWFLMFVTSAQGVIVLWEPATDCSAGRIKHIGVNSLICEQSWWITLLQWLAIWPNAILANFALILFLVCIGVYVWRYMTPQGAAARGINDVLFGREPDVNTLKEV